VAPADRSSGQPEQQAPPVQRLRIRYAKRGRMRFTSHRDFSRAFERALVRAQVPMAYSSGFSPHPRISYAGAAPTGSASEAEYLEIGLAELVDPGRLAEALDAALPDGLDVLEVVPSAGGALADRLEASVWRLTLTGAQHAAVRDAVAAFLARDEVTVERMTKKGMRSFDARAAVVRLAVVEPPADPETGPETDADTGPETGPASANAASAGPCAILELVLRHGTPSVRPDDVLAALREISGLSLGAALQQRLAQGPLDERGGTVDDPLTPDRDAVG
jgi:radical SAM-linked protein